jgi:thioredoxin-related protein
VSRRHLILYYRSGCSFCEEMQRELAVSKSLRDYRLEMVDVDSDEALQRAYDHKVPVLTDAAGEEICHHFLDPDALDTYFSTH